MTDKEALEQLLDRFGINAVQPKGGDWKGGGVLALRAQMGNVDGYDGFEMLWEFDDAGKFVKAYIWE